MDCLVILFSILSVWKKLFLCDFLLMVFILYSVIIFGKNCLRRWVENKSLNLWEGFGDSMILLILLMMCLWEMMLRWLVFCRIDWRDLCLILNLSCEVNCIVCIMWSGLLEYVVFGFRGVWMIFFLRFLRLLNGLINCLNELGWRLSVSVLMVKLWWFWLFCSVLFFMIGFCELDWYDFLCVFMNFIFRFL